MSDDNVTPFPARPMENEASPPAHLWENPSVPEAMVVLMEWSGRLHACFKDERQHGEWFTMSERLQRFVKSCQTLGRLPERWPRTA